MSHWAQIDENNVVVRVLVGDNNLPDEGEAFMKSLGGDWVQTSYNANFRKQFAGIGYSYDPINDVFISPQPFPSWRLDENFDWQPPISYPTDGRVYVWNETEGDWLDIS